MTIQFANNADTKLAAPVGVGDGTLQVVSTAGFPAVSVDNPCYVTLQQAPTDPANPPLDPKIEICLCTGIAGNTLTVARGQDGTSAKSFIVGDYVEGRIVRASLNEFLQKADAQGLLDDKANQADLDIHIGDNTNPHQVTAAQVGADPAGSADTVQGNLDTHVGDLANPHEVTAAQVGAEPELGNPATDGQVLASTTAGVRGWVTVGGGSEGEANTTSNEGTGAGLAMAKAGINLPFKTLLAESAVVTLTPTAEEIVIGVDESVIVHANLNGAGVYPHGTIDSHIDSTANPHDVTAAQVGAATVGDLTDHINDTNNPHSVTTAQIGAENALGNPAEDGQVLISTAAGVRSWAKIGGGLTISDTPPPAPDRGDLWLDSSTADMITYVWYDDGNSQQWVVQSDPFATANSAIIPNPAAGVSQSITAAAVDDTPLTLNSLPLNTAPSFVVNGDGGAGAYPVEYRIEGNHRFAITQQGNIELNREIGASNTTALINLLCAEGGFSSLNLRNAADFDVDQVGAQIRWMNVQERLSIRIFDVGATPEYFTLHRDGRFNFAAGTILSDEGHSVLVGTNAADKINLVIKARSDQTANLLELRDSNSNVLNGFDPDGRLITPETRGARVKRTSAQSIANAVGTVATWQAADFQRGGTFWAGGSPSLFTIPAGVSKVRLHGSVHFAATSGTYACILALLTSKTDKSGVFRQAAAISNGVSWSATGSSGIFDVVEGDTFSMQVLQASGAALNLDATDFTWFEIEVIE